MSHTHTADEYINRKVRFGHWKDTGVRMEGDAVKSHTVMFLEMWNFIRDTDDSFERYLRGNTAFQSLQKGFIQPYSDTPLDDITLGENVYMNILKNAAESHH